MPRRKTTRKGRAANRSNIKHGADRSNSLAGMKHCEGTTFLKFTGLVHLFSYHRITRKSQFYYSTTISIFFSRQIIINMQIQSQNWKIQWQIHRWYSKTMHQLKITSKMIFKPATSLLAGKMCFNPIGQLFGVLIAKHSYKNSSHSTAITKRFIVAFQR